MKARDNPPHRRLDDGIAAAIRERLQSAAAHDTLSSPRVADPPRELVGYLAHAELPFSRRLLQRIRESGLSEVEVYKRAHVDRKLFSKIRGDPAYQPKKTTVVAFALALQLRPGDAEALLESAGYSLSRSAPFDLIIRFFLERQIYDLLKVNDALFEFDQPLLMV